MRNMGGLRTSVPITYWTFLLATLAIAGIPPFAGFFSKDEILWKSFSTGHTAVWLIGAAAAGLTAFYMFRAVYLTFHGDFRSGRDASHLRESPPVMTVPLVILAVLSVIGGWVGIPQVLGGGNHIEHWFEPVFEEAHKITAYAAGHEAHSAGLEMTVMVISIIVALVGIWIAHLFYRRKPELPKTVSSAVGPLYDLVYNKYYVDEVYQAGIVTPIQKTSDLFLWRFFDVKIIDGLVNGVAAFTNWIGAQVRKVQTGLVQNYALIMGAAVVAIVLALVL
jgi:NADH-quinone oxidoreductase subunit L